MAGLVPAIHDLFRRAIKSWMTRPGMTINSQPQSDSFE
jgi:hypothetical protein